MGFEERAQGWLAWARTPGHDAYWRYRDAFFALVPAPGAATLEVGCGEGRVARDLVARGHRVTALDASPTLLRAAAEADPASRYVRARPRRCPSTTAPSTSSSPTTASWTSPTCPPRSTRPPACSRPAVGCAPASRVRFPTRLVEPGDDEAPLVVTESYLDERWFSEHDGAQGPDVHLRGLVPARSRPTPRRSRPPGCSSRRCASPPTPRAGAGRASRCSYVARVKARWRVGSPGLAIRTWTWSSWWTAARRARGPRRCRWGPTKSLTAPGGAEAVDVLGQRAIDLGGRRPAAARGRGAGT